MSQILTIRWILEGVCAINLEATISFVHFTKAFDSIHREKIEQIQLANGLPKETVAVMMLYRNTKVKVCSSDGHTDNFDIVAGVPQGDTLIPYLFISCLDYVLRTRFQAKKGNKHKLPRKNNYRRRLRQWHCTSEKCTRASRNPATLSGTNRCRRWPLCQCSQDGIYVL